MMKNKTSIKKAFTLVEIIMTMVIIGILIVIIMQVLQPNIKTIESRAKINAAHALISRAIIQYQAEHMCGGNLALCDEFTYDNADIEMIYDEIFADKFKLEQHCGLLIGLGCFSKDQYKYKNGAPFLNPDNSEKYYKVRLQNGISMAFAIPHAKCQDNICMSVIVDTNGPLGPNILNRDVFEGVVTTTLVKFDVEE